MNCPKCGENLEEGMKFCTKCGANVEEALKEKEEMEQKAKEEAEKREKEEQERKQKEAELQAESERLEEEKRKLEEEKRKIEEDKLRSIREAEKEKNAEENAKKAIEVSENDKEEAKKEENKFKPAQKTKPKKKSKGFIRRFIDRLILIIVLIVIIVGGIYLLHKGGYLPERASNEINKLIDQVKDLREKEKKEYKDEKVSIEKEKPDEKEKGKWKVENTIEAEDIKSLNEDVSAIEVDGKWGIIDNKNGEIHLDTKYEDIYMQESKIVEVDNGKGYYVDSKYQPAEEAEEIVYDIEKREYIFNVIDNSLYLDTGAQLENMEKSDVMLENIICEKVEIDGEKVNHLEKYIIYSSNEKNITGKEYDKIYEYSDSYAAAKRGDLAGFIDEDGNEVLFDYEETRNVYDGLAFVKKDGKWGIVIVED